jgi:signal transduction histidine kinase
VGEPHVQLEALHALARALASGEFRARAVLERACASVADGFGFERVGIVRYFPETSTLVPFAASGLSSSEMSALPAALPIGRFSAFERALAAGKGIFVEDPTGDVLPNEIATGFGIGSFVIVPLVSDGRCLGFLTCDERGRAFALQPSEVELLTTFGSLIAAFLERAIEQSELRRLNELKSQFAALASHELRTPAAAIYGAVKTLDARDAQLSPGQRAQLRRILTQQSTRLFELVENLLDLSRLEAESIRIVPTRVRLPERLASIVDTLAEDGTTVRIDAPSELQAIIDPTVFDRIITNLVSNAIRHGALPILVSARRSGSELRVTVEDQGPGVAAEFVGSLFERFTRGATDSSEGAGLGLSIAQSYARAHGGTITYEPVRPHGARFRLILPIGDPGDGSRAGPNLRTRQYSRRSS